MVNAEIFCSWLRNFKDIIMSVNTVVKKYGGGHNKNLTNGSTDSTTVTSFCRSDILILEEVYMKNMNEFTKIAIGAAAVFFVVGLIASLVTGQIMLFVGGIAFAVILLFVASFQNKPVSSDYD